MKLRFKIRLDDLFYAFFYLNVFCKAIGLGNSDIFYFVIMLFGLVVLAVKIYRSLYTMQEITFVIVMLLIGLLSFLWTEKPTLTLTCLCLSGMKDITLYRVFRDTFWIRSVSLAVMIVLAFFEVIDRGRMEMYRKGVFEVRYSFGFDHPNALHMAYFLVCISFLLAFYKKLRWYQALVLILGNVFLYHFTVSRSGMILTFLIIISAYLSLAIRKGSSVEKILCSMPGPTLLMVALFSFLVGLTNDKISAFSWLNELLTGRVAYTNYYLTHYGFTLFGNAGILSDSNALLDNGYVFIYLQYGFIGALTWLAIAIASCLSVYRSKNVMYAIALISVFLYGFSESFLPNIFLNVGLMFGYDIIFRKRSSNGHHLYTNIQQK